MAENRENISYIACLQLFFLSFFFFIWLTCRSKIAFTEMKSDYFDVLSSWDNGVKPISVLYKHTNNFFLLPHTG